MESTNLKKFLNFEFVPLGVNKETNGQTNFFFLSLTFSTTAQMVDRSCFFYNTYFTYFKSKYDWSADCVLIVQCLLLIVC